MEEYLQYMKTLRSQMNDVEDQAAMITAEEEMQLTNVRTLEKDIDSVKSEIRQLKEDTVQMKMAKGEICSQILGKQKKIASLESDYSTLAQTLELIQKERVGFNSKITEKRIYYSQVAEDMSAKLQQQHEWVNSINSTRELKESELVKERLGGQEGKASVDENAIKNNLGNDAMKSTRTKLDSAKARLDEILILKSRLVMENSKLKQAIEEVKHRAYGFKPELNAADNTTLEKEYDVLLSDKAGEIEYLQSLEKQVEKLKGIRHVVNCACGKEYTVAVNM